MFGTAGITSVHVRKLDHPIDEIRLRALDNIISKYDFGFGCNCNALKKEIILKLFNWFSFETVPQPEKVLNLLLQLVKTDAKNYLDTFGKSRFQNELHELRRKLSSQWHEKLNEIEEAFLDSEKSQADGSNTQIKDLASTIYLRPASEIQSYTKSNSKNCKRENHDTSHHSLNVSSTLDSSISLDVTSEPKNSVEVPKRIEDSIKWLTMPWQPLVTSDRGVFTAVEEALNNSNDTDDILHTCQFITNVMMQDFPAEVFLQRPTIVTILHGFLKSNANVSRAKIACVIPTVLKTLHKLTRSLRFRIYYYCEPSMANKKQKLLANKLDNGNVYTSSESTENIGGVPESRYHAYKSPRTNDRSQSIKISTMSSECENIDDSVLQLQQMLLPIYCIESLNCVLSQFNIPVDSTFPLQNIKYIVDLSYELLYLLIISVKENVWLCNDDRALKINDGLKALFNIMGEIMQHFGSYSVCVDYMRVTYLHVAIITKTLLYCTVPFEMADIIIPNILKSSIMNAIMDAPIYLLYNDLHFVLLQYAHQFQGANELSLIKLYNSTMYVARSMRATISILKDSLEPPEMLKMLYRSKTCLPLHKNFAVIKITVRFLQNMPKYSFSDEEHTLATKLILRYLSNRDIDIKHTMYVECHTMVESILGIEYNTEKLSWKNLMFLLKPNVLTEIISYGATDEDSRINKISKDILLLILKGRVQAGEDGWLEIMEALLPLLQLLQCHADTHTPLGQCITNIFDPDVSNSLQLPFIEALKGNLRFLYASDPDIREEAVCRLIWFLGKETDSIQKLPHLSSLHNLPLNSLCIFKHKIFMKIEGNYQRSNLLSVLDLLNEPNVDPKVRKSALVQISVMLSDASLHKLFIDQGGLILILDIFNKALIEKDYVNYPDSVIPIIHILKVLAYLECSVRYELSTRIDILLNIVRTLFLFPNNKLVKSDGAQLLYLLVYSDYVIKVKKYDTKDIIFIISQPYIVVTNMKMPFVCTSHGKESTYRICTKPVTYSNNPIISTFLRQYWAWEWNGGNIDMLWKDLDGLNDFESTQKLMIFEKDVLSLKYTCLEYSCQQQLYNIQNSVSHYSVICALDYLTMYLKLYERFDADLNSLPWEQTFKRFLLSHPISQEDCDLFIDILIFLQLYVKTMENGKSLWISDIMKNTTKPLMDLFKNLEADSQNMHQSIFKLICTCSAIEKMEESNGESKNTWIHFVEFVISTLCFGDQQHFYNLAYLDWLLTCLTYLIGQCEWKNHKNLLIFLCNTLIELIISFHGAGTVSFMGLSITRNSVICLNHLLHQMQVNFNKHAWVVFWQEEGRSLNWLPILWQNRDPLVRASALQLLAGLINIVCTASQLFNAIAITPIDLCYTLLRCIANREESCLVKEQACIAFCNILKNCNSIAFQCEDSLHPHTILIYVEQHNIYNEIRILCSNVYESTTLDVKESIYQENDDKPTSIQSDCISLIPRLVSYLYNCQSELQVSTKDSEIIDVDSSTQLIATPSLITAVSILLNNLLLIGQHEIVEQIYKHSIDKYLFRCLNNIPKDTRGRNNLNHYSDMLKMYISICTVLTNCIAHSNQCTAAILFSAESLYILLCLLNVDLYKSAKPHLIYLRDRLWTEIYNFIAMFSLTEDQHFETIQSALKLCGTEMVLTSICFAIKNSTTNLRMSAISCLAILLSQEIQKDSLGKNSASLQAVIDTSTKSIAAESNNGILQEVISNVNELSIRDANAYSGKSNESKNILSHVIDDKMPNQERITIGSELCKLLLHLFIAHNYAKTKKNRKQSEDKDLIVGVLANLLCVSKEAKRTALQDNLPQTILMILKEIYVKLNLQSFEFYKKQLERKIIPIQEYCSNTIFPEEEATSAVKTIAIYTFYCIFILGHSLVDYTIIETHPLLHDVNCIFMLLMNFMYEDECVKESLANVGLADMLHKLWTWIALNETVSMSALKLLATFTTKCNVAAQSLTLTTTLPGSNLRKKPNTLTLIHVIIQLACKEIEKADQFFDNHKLHCAFHILRNAVHVHECRISISKSNLLNLFTKIHPIVTKRTKPWPLVEMYCLEFLIDFTYYDEGQLCVPKAVDALDTLIHLARCSVSTSKILAISILRNIAFNVANRPRLLSSVDFINLLHDIFKDGSPYEISLAGSILWSLISNNQKGKLIIRSAGFSQSIREALGKFTLMDIDVSKQEQELTKILQYVLTILSPVEAKNV